MAFTRVRDQQKKFRIKNKTQVSTIISYIHIFYGGLDIFFDPEYIFFDQATGGIEMLSSPLEGIKKYSKQK